MTRSGSMAIDIEGRRQTGKTERAVWLTAGAICAGARPVIVAKTKLEAEQIRQRLEQALHVCGFDGMEAHQLASGAVMSSPDLSLREVTFTVREVDLP